MKHLLKVLSIRAIIMGGIATGLCFLFPAFIVPIAIAAGASYLISAAATITYAKKIDKEIDNIPRGDLEYYKFEKPGTFLENSTINAFNKIADRFDNIKDNRRSKNNINNRDRQR